MLKRKWSNKQYCGDVEIDPFDFAYRGSVFDPFKDSHRVPSVAEHMDDWLDSDAIELIDDIQLPAHRLSSTVRKHYLYFVDKMLRENYHTWLSAYNSEDNSFTDEEVMQCAEAIEMRAVQSCMITSLYRNYILKIIGEIRKQTAAGVLHPNLTDVKFKPALIKREQCNRGIQTEISGPVLLDLQMHEEGNATQLGSLRDVPVMNLEEKMRIFEERCTQPNKPMTEVPNCSWSAIDDSISSRQVIEDNSHLVELERTQPRNDAMDDEIMRELQAMFEPIDEQPNMFDWNGDQDQVNVVTETKKVEMTRSRNKTTQAADPVHKTLSPSIDPVRLVDKNDSNSHSAPDDLRRSMWPCELHMQRTKLRGILVRIAEDDYRRYEQLVQTQFVTLFGHDDGEEQDLGPYSPSIELNDVLVSSCRQRIAKWVVQALMRPLNDGLIENRFLFKKLAKRLADNIIYMNQYPDRRFVRDYITDYFCMHSNIKSINDIN